MGKTSCFTNILLDLPSDVLTVTYWFQYKAIISLGYMQ